MKVVVFCHSFVSCWNHGNAHFLRGIARALQQRGNEVTVYEPADGWSRSNALQEDDVAALEEAERLVPGVSMRRHEESAADIDAALDGADLVLVHEWNTPALVKAVGARRAAAGGFVLLFHDTHHRAVSASDEIEAFDLDDYDGVLAFGEALREIYLRRGWGRSVLTWHEAADTALFKPHPGVAPTNDLIWIGNWGDGERSAELERFLLKPAAKLALSGLAYGVRYPNKARAAFSKHGLDYKGWLPNHRVPAAYAQARLTVHVPRRPYANALPGIPTIRMFEALACGIPLVSAPWRDEEGLFPAGAYLQARTTAEMCAAFRLLLSDPAYAQEVASTGLRAVRTRHTCGHRVDELLGFVAQIRGEDISPEAVQASELSL